MDILAFTKRFINSPIGTIRTNLIKYTIASTWWQRSSLDGCISQLKLLRELFQEKSFTLIVLDSCRYDIFSKVCSIPGRLTKVRTPGSHTGEWLPKVFTLPEFREVKFFSAHPAINSFGILVHSPFLAGWRKFRATDFLSSRDIVDIWKEGWEKDLGTVFPQEVNKIVIRKGLSDRNIIWYVQPHFPWIIQRELSKRIIKESYSRKMPLEDLIRRKTRIGELTQEKIKKSYISNTFVVLYYLLKLIREIQSVNKRIVITSDHGELLGEHGLYMHFVHMNFPELRVVPWLEVCNK